MIFGYKPNKCKVQIDGVQTETKTYSDEKGSATAVFRKSGNVVTVDLALTAIPNETFGMIGGEIVAPDWAKYTGEGNIRGVNSYTDGTGLARCYMVRFSSGTCSVFAAYSHTLNENDSINISMTYIVD